jgi:hypothetical protein
MKLKRINHYKSIQNQLSPSTLKIETAPRKKEKKKKKKKKVFFFKQ